MPLPFSRRRRAVRALVWLGWVLGILLGPAGAAPPPHSLSGPLTARESAQGFREGRVLAKPKAEMLAGIDQAEAAEGLTLRAKFVRFGNVRVVGLSPGDSVPAAVARLRATGRYEYVEPDYLRRIAGVPDDPQFVSQWALSNTGANGGVAGADIHAEGGWNVITSTLGTKALIGIVDSGALLTHQDLVANLWMNPSPGSVLAYSDGGGSATETDSLNGLNAVAQSGTPADDLGHGTHVSGIAGAVGNNALGVTGVAWSTQLMELKFIDSSGTGSTSDELPCLEYAVAHKVTVINASYGDTNFSQAEMDAIHAAGQAGVIFVCAAGNSSENVDISPFYPADYPLDNIICVGATDNRDLPVYFSNYGSGSVELFAPGDSILSTFYTGVSDYGYYSGTSMATPFVTGTVALLQAKFPTDTYRETINRVLNSVDVIPGLAGKCLTGGRLDLQTALTTAANTPPNATFAHRANLVGLDPYTRSNNTDSPLALEAGTPSLATGAGHSLWWQWTAPEDAKVEIDTSGTQGGDFPGGSTYATALGVYTGSSLGSLTTVATSLNFGTEPLEGGGGSAVSYSEVSFHAAAGTTYQINVQGQNGASGQTILAINTTPDNASVSTPRVLAGLSTAVLDANPNAASPGTTPLIDGTNGGHTLWYAWTAPKSGPAEAAAYSYDFQPALAVYTGSGANLTLVAAAIGGALEGTDTDAAAAYCAFTAAAGTTYLIQVDGFSASDIGEFTVSVDDALWQVSTTDAITGSPSVGPDGTVYVGSDDNSFYAISAGGETKWTYAAGSVFDTSAAPIGPDGTIYAGNSDGTLYAFNPDGMLKWTYALPTAGSGNTIDCSPALGASGSVYFHGSDGNLYALNSAGALQWTLAVGGDSYAAPTVAPDGTIYLGTDGGLFYAVNPDGTQKWLFTCPVAGESIYTAAAIDAAGNTYFGTLSGNLYSLDPAGTLRWTYGIGNGITSAPALAGGRAYFGGYDGNLYAVATASGALQWKYALGAQVRASAPAVDANGVIYIGCYDHNVYAVSAGGTLDRIYAADDIIRSSPVISGTSLYFGSNDHKVYAFDIGASASGSAWPMYQFNAQRVGRAIAAALAITSQPSAQSVATGSPFSLTVGATGPGALTFQWNLNGAAIAGAVDSTYAVASATAADGGSYTVTVTSDGASVTSAPVAVTVGAAIPGRIVNLSARANVGTGGDILIAGFVISGSSSKSVVLRGVGPTLGTAPFNVAGVLAQPQLTLINTASGATIVTGTAWGGSAALAGEFALVGAFALPANSADAAVQEDLPAGSYTSQISGVNTGQGVALAEIYDADPGSTASSLVNISARAYVGTGADIVIAGFVIQGSQPAQVLLRGIGPTLGTAPFNVPAALAQPQIELFNSAGAVIQSNSGWGGTAALSAAFAQAGAFPLPAGSADAAMIVSLPAGSYTLQLSGVNGTTGVGLVEVYLIP